jgi:hypothetical protein
VSPASAGPPHVDTLTTADPASISGLKRSAVRGECEIREIS